MVVILDRPIVVLFTLGITITAVGISLGVSRIQPDCLVKVFKRMIIVFFTQVGDPHIVIRDGVVRVEPECIIIFLDREIILPLSNVDIAFGYEVGGTWRSCANPERNDAEEQSDHIERVENLIHGYGWCHNRLYLFSLIPTLLMALFRILLPDSQAKTCG